MKSLLDYFKLQKFNQSHERKQGEDLWELVARVAFQHEQRIKTLERRLNEMSERTNKLDAEISQLDANEQKEEAEIADLKSRVSELEDELVAAQNSGDNAAIDAATNKLHDVNARLSALLEAGASTNTSTAATAPALEETTPNETTLQVNIPPEDTNTVKG